MGRPKSDEELTSLMLRTHDGHKLTIKQYKFIDFYIKYGNIAKAAREAGYSKNNANQSGNALMQIEYVRKEIEWRMQQFESEKIADAQEIMEYFTRVMRGEVKDQFGLDAPLSERTKAAIELARRRIDMANKQVTEESSTVKLVIERKSTGSNVIDTSSVEIENSDSVDEVLENEVGSDGD
jgi:phage terminase small subunit